MVNIGTNQKTHPIVFADYFPRVVGLGYTAIILFTIFYYQGGHHELIWITVFLYGFVYPHVAYFIASRSKYSLQLEQNFILLDAAMGGIFIAITGFPYWYFLYTVATIAMSSISVRGIKRYLLSLSVLGLAAVIAGYFNSFEFNPSTNWIIDILCVLGLVGSGWICGYLTWHQARLEKNAKQRTKEAVHEVSHINKVIQVASETLEIDEVMKKIMDALQDISSFESAAIQLPDKDRKHLYFYSIISKYATESYINEVKKLKVDLEGIDSLTAKVFTKQEAYYQPDINPSLEMFPLDRKMFEIKPFLSIIILPILIKKETIGVISIYSHTKSFKLTDIEINKIEKQVAQISMVINNALLYEKSQQNKMELVKKQEELESLSNKMIKYLSPQVCSIIFSQSKTEELQAKRERLTVFFSDIEGFTDLTDRLESETLTSMINVYLNDMSKIVQEYGGTIDKYIGDAIMAFFGEPVSKGYKEDALNCTMMAIAMRERLEVLRNQWVKEGISQSLRVRIGINTGFCTVGNMGSKFKLSYTAIGSNVNLAVKIQEHAKPSEILISEQTYLQVKDKIYCEPKGEVDLYDKNVKVFNVIESYEKMPAIETEIVEETSGFQMRLDELSVAGTDKDEIVNMLDNVKVRLGASSKKSISTFTKYIKSFFKKHNNEKNN